MLLDNVAPGAPVDMSNAKTGSGGDVKSGTMTTTADGDLVMIFKATDFANAPLHSAGSGRHDAPSWRRRMSRTNTGSSRHWQAQNGATEETEFSFPQLVNWVAAQVAIKHGSH